ncbi:hypothetical protein D3C75_624770 [compost metagenome]
MTDWFSATMEAGGNVTINGVSYPGGSISIGRDGILIDGEVQGNILGLPQIIVNIIGNVGKVQTATGDIDIQGDCTDVYSTSGDIHCWSVDGDVQNVSGDINCGNVAGNVKTLSGNIRYKQG